jgi:hypothetical protein
MHLPASVRVTKLTKNRRVAHDNWLFDLSTEESEMRRAKAEMRDMHKVRPGVSIFVAVRLPDRQRVRLCAIVDIAGTGRNIAQCAFAGSCQETTSE